MSSQNLSSWWVIGMVAATFLLSPLFTKESFLLRQWIANNEPVSSRVSFGKDTSTFAEKAAPRSLLADGGENVEESSEEVTSGVHAGNYVQVLLSFGGGGLVMAVICVVLRIYINKHPHVDINDPSLVLPSEHWKNNFAKFGSGRVGTDDVEQEKGFFARFSSKPEKKPKKKELYRQKSKIDMLAGKMEIEITAEDVDISDDDLDGSSNNGSAEDLELTKFSVKAHAHHDVFSRRDTASSSAARQSARTQLPGAPNQEEDED